MLIDRFPSDNDVEVVRVNYLEDSFVCLALEVELATDMFTRPPQLDLAVGFHRDTVNGLPNGGLWSLAPILFPCTLQERDGYAICARSGVEQCEGLACYIAIVDVISRFYCPCEVISLFLRPGAVLQPATQSPAQLALDWRNLSSISVEDVTVLIRESFSRDGGGNSVGSVGGKVGDAMLSVVVSAGTNMACDVLSLRSFRTTKDVDKQR